MKANCCGGLIHGIAASGGFFQNEIASPLRLDFYIRLPETISNSRFATLVSQVPAGGGVGTARAMARAYMVFATGGRDLGLRPETLQALTAPAVPAASGFYDACMKPRSATPMSPTEWARH
jgi:hypothetical protein